MEEQEPVTRAELSTPARESVFNRLYARRKAEVKTKSQALSLRAGAEKVATNKCKGRPVPSKFSESTGVTKKGESQRQNLGRRFSFKTPAASVFQRTKPKPSTKQSNRVTASVRLAKSKLQSAKYWFSLVDVAEKAENHLVAVGLFRLAISCSAEPTSEVRKAYAAYRARYKLEPSEECLDAEAGGDAEPDPSKVCNVEVHIESPRDEDCCGELEVICDDWGAVPKEEIESKKDEGVKNLFEEVYSRIPPKVGIECEQSAGNHSVSEVINVEELPEVTSPSKPLERLATPRPRGTPLRASAIRAAQRIEESAKKQFRKKYSEHKAETSTPAKATGALAVEKMDVNTLMKEVVGMLAGSNNEVQSPAEEPAKTVSVSPNKTNKTADNTIKKSGKKPSKAASSNEQVETVNESSVNGSSNISEKENVLNSGAADEERKEPIKVAPSPGEAKRSGRVTRSTPKKSNKAPFH